MNIEYTTFTKGMVRLCKDHLTIIREMVFLFGSVAIKKRHLVKVTLICVSYSTRRAVA